MYSPDAFHDVSQKNAQQGRNLPGDNDPQPGWQAYFAASSRRREHRDSRVRVCYLS